MMINCGITTCVFVEINLSGYRVCMMSLLWFLVERACFCVFSMCSLVSCSVLVKEKRCGEKMEMNCLNLWYDYWEKYLLEGSLHVTFKNWMIFVWQFPVSVWSLRKCWSSIFSIPRLRKNFSVVSFSKLLGCFC